MKRSMQLVIYARYSSDMQNPRSCQDQEREVRRGLDRLKIDHSHAVVLFDEAISGTNPQREKFVQLQEMVDRKETIFLVVDDQARLTRAGNALDFIKDIVFEGGRFLSTTEGIDTTQPGWELRVKVTEMKNSMVIDGLGPMVRRGQSGRLLRNLTAGDYPYGYESFYVRPEQAQHTGRGPKPEKDLRIKETESCWIIKMALWFISGWSFSRIAAELESCQAPRNRRAKNRPWSDTSVRNILQNPKYGTGIWIRNKTTSIHSSGTRGQKKRTKQIPVPEADWTSVERPDLKILTPELWEQVQSRFRELGQIFGKKEWQKQRGPKVHHSAVYPQSLLGGLLYCKCGARMHYKSSGSNAYFACPRAVESGSCDMRTGVKIAQTEQQLLELVSQICTGSPEWLRLAAELTRRKADDLARTVPASLEADQLRLREVQGQSENIARDVAVGNSSSALRRLAADLEQQESDLTARIRTAERLLARAVKLPDDAWLAQQLAALPQLLREDASRTAEVLRELFGRITVRAVVAVGKKRGYAQLRFQIDGAAVLKMLLRDNDIAANWSHLQIESGADGVSEEVVMDLGRSQDSDQWGPHIVAWRKANVPWKVIYERTGLPKATAYAAWRRHGGRVIEDVTHSTDDAA